MSLNNYIEFVKYINDDNNKIKLKEVDGINEIYFYLDVFWDEVNIIFFKVMKINRGSIKFKLLEKTITKTINSTNENKELYTEINNINFFNEHFFFGAVGGYFMVDVVETPEYENNLIMIKSLHKNYKIDTNKNITLNFRKNIKFFNNLYKYNNDIKCFIF